MLDRSDMVSGAGTELRLDVPPQATVGVDRPSCFVEAGVALVEAIEEPEMPRMRQCAVGLLDLMKDRGCSLIASWQYSTGCRPNIPGGTVEQKSLI
jgi:hypothetical protein